MAKAREFCPDTAKCIEGLLELRGVPITFLALISTESKAATVRNFKTAGRKLKKDIGQIQKDCKIKAGLRNALGKKYK